MTTSSTIPWYQVSRMLFLCWYVFARSRLTADCTSMRYYLRLSGVGRGQGLLGRRAPRCSAWKPSGGVIQAQQGRLFRHFRRQCAFWVIFYPIRGINFCFVLFFSFLSSSFLFVAQPPGLCHPLPPSPHYGARLHIFARI